MRQLKILKQITNRENDSISRYFREISKYELISAEEEVELTTRIRDGDMQAMEKLVTANLRFVVSVAKQYQYKGLSLQDLINEGNVGLVKAAYRFDLTRGFKFISYAVWWIRQSIIQAIAEQTRIVRLPLNKVASINKIAKAIPKLEQEFQREPTDDEIAQLAQITEQEVFNTRKIRRTQLSFDAPLSSDGEDDFNLYDVVGSTSIPQPDESLLVASLRQEIDNALFKLTEREAYIIKMFYGLNSEPSHSLSEISHNLGITTERVRQLRQIGIDKLKRAINRNAW
ncbi:MAG: RNA polymerase sigma factor RpoD/SigA [Bacteroidales bacterium]|nr:RNA polymerase sigma factor RpoD/SigA [Bacteroidales bacterium]MBN2763346.1 RNA polymerase sigma factor RpoD/SigA [Bacteroidales bacterium]